MIETYLRPIYQLYLLDPLAKKISLKAGNITYLSCLTGVLVAPLLVFTHPTVAILFLLISGFLDTLDGSVARMTNTTSLAGSVLDIISDRIVELAVMLGLYFLDPTHRALGVLAMLGSCYLCITSFLVVGIVTQNQSIKGFHYNQGIIERAEAFLFFIAMIIFPQQFNFLAMIFTGLVLLTSYLHIKRFINLN